jgi:hypothetical protein
MSYSHVSHLSNSKSKEGNSIYVCGICGGVRAVWWGGVGQYEGYEVVLGTVWDINVWGGGCGYMGFVG